MENLFIASGRTCKAFRGHGLQYHSLHIAQLQTEVLVELRTLKIHTQHCQPL